MRIAETQEQRITAVKAHIKRLAAVFKRETDEFAIGRSTLADVTEAEQALDQATMELFDVLKKDGGPDIQEMEREVGAVRNRHDDVQRLIQQHTPPLTKGGKGG